MGCGDREPEGCLLSRLIGERKGGRRQEAGGGVGGEKGGSRGDSKGRVRRDWR